MPQKRCLNCNDFKPDDLELSGEPIPPGVGFSYAGFCGYHKKRMKDSWSCGEHTMKVATKHA